MFAVLMLAKYIALLGMHEVLIAVRSNLVHFVHESSRCEPNKRGVSPEVGGNPSLQSLATPAPLSTIALR